MRINQIVLYGSDARPINVFSRLGQGRWQTMTQAQSFWTDDVIEHIRSVLTEQASPTPEERAANAIERWRNRQDHELWKQDDDKLAEEIQTEIQAAIDADRQAR